MRLSVLDQSPISEGSSGAQALANSVELARLADELGFRRYWVAEHHGGPMLASPSPEVLIAHAAALTRRIRVGSGGVMLPHYSPLKVAEVFSMLAALHPGRIDLGLGRAAGTDPLTTFALQRDRRQAAPDDFPQQLAELLAYLEDSLPDDHPFRHLAGTLPGVPHVPEPWLLGSSPQSAVWAAELDLPYAFADFINPAGAGIAADYSRRVTEAHGRRPDLIVAVWALCAPTEEEAQHLAASSRMTLRLLRRGQLIPVPPPEKAVAFLEREGAAGSRGVPGRRAVIGDPGQVRAGLETVLEEYCADEVMIVTITHDHAARLRSYRLIAEATGLEGPAAQADAAPLAGARHEA